MTSANDPDLSELPNRIRGGDRLAESELAARFRERVYVMALARTRDREAALEIAQDVMVAVLVALRDGRLRKSESLASFVFSTARHHVGSHLRSAVRDRSAPPQPTRNPNPSPEEQMEANERLDLIRRALKELGPADREILILTLVEGLTPREIAFRLDVDPDVVRQRKSRAKRRIMEMIADPSRS
jgi:RNA polymerase sigma-70 factor (ECF subfamily)